MDLQNRFCGSADKLKRTLCLECLSAVANTQSSTRKQGLHNVPAQIQKRSLFSFATLYQGAVKITLSVLGKHVQLFYLLQAAPTDVRGEVQARDPRALLGSSKGHCLSPIHSLSCAGNIQLLLLKSRSPLPSASLLPSYPISTLLIIHTCTFFTPYTIMWRLTNPNHFVQTTPHRAAVL